MDLVLELDGRKWIYYESPAFDLDEKDALVLDEGFEPMEKGCQPSQEEFYIHSHAFQEESMFDQ